MFKIPPKKAASPSKKNSGGAGNNKKKPAANVKTNQGSLLEILNTNIYEDSWKTFIGVIFSDETTEQDVEIFKKNYGISEIDDEDSNVYDQCSILNDKNKNNQLNEILKIEDSKVVKALSESIIKGRRKKFHIISYQDISDWANENAKNFEECMEYKQINEKIDKIYASMVASQQSQNPSPVDEISMNNESSAVKNDEPVTSPVNTTQSTPQDQEQSIETQLEELTKKKLEYLSKFLKVKFVQLKLSDIEARVAEKEALAKKAAEEEQMNNLQPPGLLQQNQNQNQDEGKKKDKEKNKKNQGGKNGSQDKKQDKDSSSASADANNDKNQNKRRVKLRQRIVNVDPIPVAVNDEPESGPEIYYLLYGFTNPQLFDYLAELDLHVDALIRVEEIPKGFISIPPEVKQSKSEIDISKKIENPLDLLDSQSTSNRSKFSKLSLDDQSSLYSYNNNMDDKISGSTKIDPNKNTTIEEGNKNSENELTIQQSLDIKISNVTWKKSLNSNIIKYKIMTISNSINSIWKDVVWCDVPFKQKDEPDIIFDQVAFKIYEILEKKNLYDKYYDNTLVISIPQFDKETNLKYYKYLSEVASYIEPSLSIEIWLEILINFALKTMNINDPTINIENIDDSPYFKILNIPWNNDLEKQEEIIVKETKETKDNKNKDKQLNVENQVKNQQNQSTLSINDVENLSILNIQKKVNLNNENKEFLGYSSFDCYFDDIVSNISLINTEESIEKKTEDENNDVENINREKSINYNKYQIIPKDNYYLNYKLLYDRLKIIGINIDEVYDTFLKFLTINRLLKYIHKEMNIHQNDVLENNQFHSNVKCTCNSNNRDILLRKTELLNSTNFPEVILKKALIQCEFESLINMEIKDITNTKKSMVLDEYCWVENHDKDTMVQIIEKYKSIYPEMIYKISNFENGTLLIMKSPGPMGCLVSETYEKSQVKNKVNFGLFYEYYDNKKEYLECPELKFIPKKNNDENIEKKFTDDQSDTKKNANTKKKGKKGNEKEKTPVPEKSKNQSNKKNDKVEKTDKKKGNQVSSAKKVNELVEETTVQPIENEKIPTNYIYNTDNNIILYNDRNLYVYPCDGNIIQIKTINSLTYNSIPQIYYNIYTPFASISYGIDKNNIYTNYLYINYNDDSTFSFKLSKNGKPNMQFYTNDGILSQYYEDGKIKQKLTTYNKYNLKYQVSDKIELHRIIIPGGKILKVKSSQNYEVYYPNGNITYYDNEGNWTSINEKGKCVQTNSSNETKELPSLNVFYETQPIPHETKHIRSDMVVIRYTDGLNRIVEFPSGIKISSYINIKNENDNNDNILNDDDDDNNNNTPPKIESFDSLVNVYRFNRYQVKASNYDEEFKMNETIDYKNLIYKCESDGFPTTIHYKGGTEIHTIYKTCKVIQFMSINEEQKLTCNKIRILKFSSCFDIYMDGKICFIPYYKDDSNLTSKDCSRYNIDIKSEELAINDVNGKEYKIIQNKFDSEYYSKNNKEINNKFDSNNKEIDRNENTETNAEFPSETFENEENIINNNNEKINENEKLEEQKFINNSYKKISTNKLLFYGNSNIIHDDKDINDGNNDICGLFNISSINNNIFTLKENIDKNILIKNLMKTSFSEKMISNGNSPKLLFIYEDGTGFELLRDVDIYHTINEMNINIEKDIIEEPLTDNSKGISVTITKKMDKKNIGFNIADSKIILYKQLIRYPQLTLSDRKQILDELNYYNNWLEMHKTFIEDNDNILENIYNNVKIENENDNINKQSNKLVYGVNKEETENAILEKYSELLIRNSMKSDYNELNNNKSSYKEVNPNEVSENHKKRYKILKNSEANVKKDKQAKNILKIDEEIKNSVRESSIFPNYFDTIDSSKLAKEDLNKYKKKDTKKKERKVTSSMKFSNINSSISIKKKKKDISESNSTNSSLSSIIFNGTGKNNNSNIINDNYKEITESSKSKSTELSYRSTESLISNDEPKYKIKPNINYQIIEAGAKRKLKTTSTINESKSLESLISKATLNSNTVNIKKLEKIYKEKFQYLLNLDPKSCEFGMIKENSKNLMKINIMNKTNDTIRFKIVQPESEYIKIKYKVGPISPGLQIKIAIEINSPKTENKFTINDYGQIITENEIIKIPISATILPNDEYEKQIK